MILGATRKQPNDLLDYSVDFSQWFPRGDLITNVETHLNPEGDLKIISYSISSGQTVHVWCKGGETATTYKLTILAATAGGRIKEADFRLRIREI